MTPKDGPPERGRRAVVDVRDAAPADAAACAAIYAPYVLDTAISFETVPPTADEIAGRIAAAQVRHAWLVATRAEPARTGPGAADGGRVVGYAYGGPHRTRQAYRWCCEVSVYVAAGRCGAGTGRALYTVLLDRLAALGYRTAVAGMTLPNPASAGLHRALGFEPVGTFRRQGWKHGAWHDVGWVERPLGPDADSPAADSPAADSPGPVGR
jgi:L-amino acid N-acyltransferase YncA